MACRFRSLNHGYDPRTFLKGIPAHKVVQFHMAGHSHMGTHIIDTHDYPVCDEVWELYAAAVKRFGAVPTMTNAMTISRRSTNSSPRSRRRVGSRNSSSRCPSSKMQREALRAGGIALSAELRRSMLSPRYRQMPGTTFASIHKILRDVSTL
jgi:hypothetical protein